MLSSGQLLALRVLPPVLHPPWYATALLLLQLNMLTREKVNHLAIVLLVFLQCWSGSEQLKQVLEPL